MNTPVFYAHRGASIEQPENTLPAFHRALELGADAIETDIHLTRDGHLVISHDPDAERMAGVPLVYAQASIDEIRALNVGQRFTSKDGGAASEPSGYRIPTLEEVLTEFPDIPFNVDIKQPGRDIAERVVALIRRLGATERVVLASFHFRTLLTVRRLGYEGRTGMAQPEVAALRLSPERAFRALPYTGQMVQIPTEAGPIRLATPGFIAKCHRLGLHVDFWTINDPDQARKLLALGADGIMTDDPAAIAPVFQELRAQSGR